MREYLSSGLTTAEVNNLIINGNLSKEWRKIVHGYGGIRLASFTDKVKLTKILTDPNLAKAGEIVATVEYDRVCLTEEGKYYQELSQYGPAIIRKGWEDNIFDVLLFDDLQEREEYIKQKKEEA